MPGIPDYTFKYHKRGGHEVTYIIINQESGSTSYYQYMNTKGFWYMMRSVRTAAVTVYTYTVPVNTSDSTGWTNKASLTYTTPNVAFVE